MGGQVSLKIDLHVHSEASFDGKEPVELILEHAADIGLDSVVITDHDEIDEARRAAEMADDYGLIGIPGVEVSTKAGHLLAVGVDEKPEKANPWRETVERVKELGGAAVVPHPFQRTRHGVRKKKIEDPDAIEVYNSWLFTGYRNRRAKRFARKKDIPGVAASDAHSVTSVGRAYTEILFEDKESKDDISSDDVVREIRKGKLDIYGRRAPLHKSAGHYVKGMGRKMSYKTRALLASIDIR